MCLNAICDCRQEILQQLSLGRVLSEHEDEITKIQGIPPLSLYVILTLKGSRSYSCKSYFPPLIPPLSLQTVSGRRYAVKVYDKAKLTLETSRFMRNEVHILKQISAKHLNLHTLHESFESNSHGNPILLPLLIPTVGVVYLVMDMAEGGDLYEHIVQNGCFQEREAARLVAYLLSALEFLHQFDIIHRGKLY